MVIVITANNIKLVNKNLIKDTNPTKCNFLVLQLKYKQVKKYKEKVDIKKVLQIKQVNINNISLIPEENKK